MSQRANSLRQLGALATALALAMACSKQEPGSVGQGSTSSDPRYLGVTQLAGPATLAGVDSGTTLSLAAPAPNLSEATLEGHLDGDAKFEREFISTDGLGAAFNNTSCRNCHVRDGRGSLPPIPFGQSEVKLSSNEALLVRISIEESDAPVPKDEAHGWGAPVGVPGFSAQLFHRGVYGLRPDSPGTGQADVYMRFVRNEVVYADGSAVTLRKPAFDLRNAYDGAASRLHQADVRTSPRLAPPMTGLGLLEAIPQDQILALADPDDRDRDGISGRPNWVLDRKLQLAGVASPLSLGRFGFKASNPSLRQQTVAALNNDMGMTTQWLSLENISGTPLYESFLARQGLPAPRQPDVTDEFVDRTTLYAQTLGVPERRRVGDETVRRGGRLFQAMNCVACHAVGYQLKGVETVAEFEGIEIFPFTDLLLHDMGEGLADHRRDFDADGREWKTPALWGIGVTHLVNPRAGFLHDGRARTLEEAVLWHGGEAEKSAVAFRSASRDDREALLRFLESL